MDEIVGLLDDYAGYTVASFVCSDHGFTAWEVSVHTNALLEEWGYLEVKPGPGDADRRLRGLVPLAKRSFRARSHGRRRARRSRRSTGTRRRRSRPRSPSRASSSISRAASASGSSPRTELESLKEEIAVSLPRPEGPRRRAGHGPGALSEDVFHGDALEGRPTSFPVLRDHRFELDDEIFHREPFTDLSSPAAWRAPSGRDRHRRGGRCRGRSRAGSVLDVTPTLLYLAGLKVPEGLDGRVIDDASNPGTLTGRPVRTMPPYHRGQDEARPTRRRRRPSSKSP